MELKDGVSRGLPPMVVATNPFNGIESSPSGQPSQPYHHANPFNGIESRVLAAAY